MFLKSCILLFYLFIIFLIPGKNDSIKKKRNGWIPADVLMFRKWGIFMWGCVIALISGILMSVQGVWNAGVTKQSGVWMASAFVQLLALLVCIVAWFVTGRQGTISDLLHVQPKYLLLGGALGAFITYTVIESMNRLGAARSVMLIVCAQLIAAYLINLFGWFGAEKEVFEWRKLIGVAVFIAGVIIFKWK